MRHLLICFIVPLCLPLLALADVTGTWTGWGQWTFQGSGADCTMGIIYRETETELARVKGTFDCGIVALHSDPLSWKKLPGGGLELGGSPAGSFNENGFDAAEDYGAEVKVSTKFSREGNHADYEERWVNTQGQEIYLIRGRLFLKERRR